jgi:hypothetical protein
VGFSLAMRALGVRYNIGVTALCPGLVDANGVHPKVASERLGHSKVGITLDLYSHVMPGMQEDAAALVDDALRTAINKRTKTIG